MAGSRRRVRSARADRTALSGIVFAADPVDAIADAADAFAAAHFRPQMIGVHVRRGDLVGVYPGLEQSSDRAIAAVDRFLRTRPNAAVYLCTDDGAVCPRDGRRTTQFGVAAQFEAHFGERIIRHVPRTLDRADPISIEASLIELLLLRRTQMFVGTQGSGFSHFVYFGREVPRVLIGVADGAPQSNAARVRKVIARIAGRLRPQ